MSHRPRLRGARAVRGLLPALVLTAASCAGSVNLKEAVQVTEMTTGWFDAGVVDGKNKLVPNLTFRLRNASDREVPAVSLNIVFRFADNGEIHDEVYKQRIPLEGKQTDLITIRSATGFMGQPPQTRLEMLQNSYFRDMDAVILVRQSSAEWIELHRVRVERKLLTQ